MSDAMQGAETVTFDGGTDQDRRQLLEVHRRFVAANDVLKSEELRKIWSAAEGNVFFNANGFNYTGLDDWLKVWDYYRERLRMLKPATMGHVRITIRGDMALITDDQVSRFRTWAGREGEPEFNTTPSFRATQVCVRENGEWKVIHAHFSSGNIGQRPDEQA